MVFSERCSVQAIIRTDRIIRGGSDGNLLKAQSDGEVKLSVDFTGTDQDNQPSGIQVIHLIREGVFHQISKH